MKILVLSQLRLGDIFLMTPALRGLRYQYPEAQIDLWVNSQFMGVAPLIPYVTNVWGFERNELQNGLGQPQRSLFEPHARLTKQIENLNAQDYDLALNLTHTRISGWLMSLIKAKDKRGLTFDENGQAHFGSAWFEYLNSQTDDESDRVFHYGDVFQYASGLKNTSPFIRLSETPAGLIEAQALTTRHPNFIAYQALTSDIKKDWGSQRWSEFAKLMHERHADHGQIFLAAPNEQAQLQPIVDKLQAEGVNAEVLVCSLEGALSILHMAKLLVTGDTSIKHLACSTRVPMIELSIGSSDYHRTGAYKTGAIIIQGKESCAPCVHSKPCHRTEQFCAKKISADAVALIASQVLSGLGHQIATIAEEFQDEMTVLRTEMRSGAAWTAYSVTERFSEDGISRWLDRSGRKLYLRTRVGNVDWVEDVLRETENLSRLMQKAYPTTDKAEWRGLLVDLENQVVSVEARLMGFQTGLESLRGTYENPAQLKAFVQTLIGFREHVKRSTLLQPQRESLDSIIEDDRSPAFTRYRRIVNTMTEIRGRVQIELKLIRTLQNQMEMSS